MADNTSQLEFNEYGVWFSPSPGAYAAVRINAVEMVRHLQDEEALRAAMAMRTKTYLVCLQMELDLPFPNKPWYRFRALPIAPHLAPPNDAEGYTPDMCIPIFPNTRHPTGRAPVPSVRPFPYGNCYYWLDHTVFIRVRARAEGFDETNAVKIPSRAEVLMRFTWAEDMKRAMATVASREAARGEVHPDRPQHIACSGDNEACAAPCVCEQHQAQPARLPEQPPDGTREEDSASISSCWSLSSGSAGRPIDSVGDIMHTDVFTGPDEDLALVPLVDLWPDIASRLKEEDIPSPLELYQEIAGIQSIIQQARVRAYAALTAQSSKPKEVSVSETTPSGPIHERFVGLRTVCRKIFWPAKRLTSYAKRVSRLPYIAVWP